MTNLDTKQIKDKAKRWLTILAKRSFITSLFLILLSVLLGGILYYRYIILLDKQEPQPSTVSLKFRQEVYKNVLDEWEKMNENFEGGGLKNYLDPFSPR